MAESRISAALCGVMEQALIEKGVSPDLARMLASRACEPVVDKSVSVAKKTARSGKKKVSKYAKEWGKQLKKLKSRSRKMDGSYRSGWNREKEFSTAHKMTKKALK